MRCCAVRTPSACNGEIWAGGPLAGNTISWMAMAQTEDKPRNDASRQDDDASSGVSEREIEDIEERSRLRAPVVYEIIRREGDTEMQRPGTSLWWSGVAAGLSISFSLLAQ